MKKLTIEFIRGEFEKDGYTLLSTEYINCKKHLFYSCPVGHKGAITYDNWQQGRRCGKCGDIITANKQKLTVEFVKKEFKKDNYTLLTTKYVNSDQKLEYICPKGHKGSITWGNWQQGHRCFGCFGTKKLTIEFIRKQFKKEGYTLLTKNYINTRQKLKYICPIGHKGTIICDNWQQGGRCRQCYLENNKGKNNPNWNPDKTDEERENGRSIPGYDNWRGNTKVKDDFICQVCKKRGGNLEAHHIEAYNSAPELRTELSNGVTLCKKCHDNFHNKYGRGNNTREQFEEFVNNY